MLIHRIYRYESFLAAFKESDPEKRERYLLLLCLDLPEPHLHTTSWVWLFPYLARFLHFPQPRPVGEVRQGAQVWAGWGLVWLPCVLLLRMYGCIGFLRVYFRASK